jgi:hypothetical protein
VAEFHCGYHIMPPPLTWLAPIATIEYLQAELTLAGNHDLGMAIAQFDLTDWPASGVKLAENDRRAIPGASRRLAGTQVTASPDLNCRRREIKVRFEHRLCLSGPLSFESIAYVCVAAGAASS